MNTEQFKPGIAYSLPLPAEFKGGSQIRYAAFRDGDEEWTVELSRIDTHWCIMPEIPKPKSQADLDSEWISSRVSTVVFGQDVAARMLQEAINYARK